MRQFIIILALFFAACGQEGTSFTIPIDSAKPAKIDTIFVHDTVVIGVDTNINPCRVDSSSMILFP